MHVHAVNKFAHTYEHMDPALVGNERRILVSELSGRSNIAALTADHKLPDDRKVLDLILQLKAKGISSIIVSHRMDDIFTTADRIIVLRRGRKIEDVRKEHTSMDDIIKKIINAEKESTSQETETMSQQTA